MHSQGDGQPAEGAQSPAENDPFFDPVVEDFILSQEDERPPENVQAAAQRSEGQTPPGSSVSRTGARGGNLQGGAHSHHHGAEAFVRAPPQLDLLLAVDVDPVPLPTPDVDGLVRDREYREILGVPLLRSPKSVLHIIAPAGGGKSEVLIDLVREHAAVHSHVLYLVYNKDAQKSMEGRLMEAKKRWRASHHSAATAQVHVDVRTFHSLALEASPHFHQASNRSKHERLPLGDLDWLSPSQWETVGVQAMSDSDKPRALKTLRNFMASTNPQMSAVHLPAESMEPGSEDKILRAARAVWDALPKRKHMWKGVEPNMPRMPHDAYLKHVQLNPRLLDALVDDKYSLILCDEAHDLTPAQLSLLFPNRSGDASLGPVVGEPRCTTVLVYDPHQSIYAFRGASGASILEQRDQAELRLSLTMSWRYGQSLALAAQALIRHYKKLPRHTMRGQPGRHTVLREMDRPPYGPPYGACGNGPSPQGEPLTVLARYNVKVLELALEAVTVVGLQSVSFLSAAEEHSSWGKERHEGHLAPVGGRAMLDGLAHFAEGTPVDDILDSLPSVLRRFAHGDDPLGNFRRWAEGLKSGFGVQYLLAADFAQRYGGHLSSMLDALRDAVRNPLPPQAVFATAHKSKGLQWPRVYLAEDYVSKAYSGPLSLAVSLTSHPLPTGMADWLEDVCAALREHDTNGVEELNILYVGLTRGQVEVTVHSNVGRWLALAGVERCALAHPAEAARGRKVRGEIEDGDSVEDVKDQSNSGPPPPLGLTSESLTTAADGASARDGKDGDGDAPPSKRSRRCGPSVVLHDSHRVPHQAETPSTSGLSQPSQQGGGVRSTNAYPGDSPAAHGAAAQSSVQVQDDGPLAARSHRVKVEQLVDAHLARLQSHHGRAA